MAPAWTKVWPENHGTGEKSADMWKGHSVSALRKGDKEADQAASLPRTTKSEQGDAQHHCQLLLPLRRVASRAAQYRDTIDMLQGEDSTCPGSSEADSLLLPLCGHICEVCKSQHAPLSSLQRTCQLDTPCLTPLVCKPERERGPAGAHRLGNDEGVNLQERSETHSAFWTVVTFARHLLSSFARVLALAAGIRRHRICPKQGYLRSQLLHEGPC